MSDLNPRKGTKNKKYPRRGTKNHEGTRRKTKRKGTRRDTKTDGPASTTSGTKIRLQFCALGVTMSWDDGLLGARASRPHQAWHSLGHLPHLHQPGTAPWLSYGLAAAVPADRVAACGIALKLSGGQRDRMRAGRPRSQGNHSPLEGESQKPSRQAKADAVGGGWRATFGPEDPARTINKQSCISYALMLIRDLPMLDIEINRMLYAWIKSLSTLHSPLSTLHSPLLRPGRREPSEPPPASSRPGSWDGPGR